MEIAVQIVGVFGILASVISFQCKKYNFILFFRICNEFIFAIQYLLLGAYTGMIANLIGCIRNIIFTKLVSNNKRTTAYIITFSITFIFFGLVFWQGKKSILVISAKILSTLAYGNKNTTIVRLVIFITGVAWLIYNYTVFSYAGVVCEAFTLISLIFGIIRFDLIPAVVNKRENKNYPN